MSAAIGLANITKLDHQLWACGSDFQYQNADHWFHNLDKIIHYINYNASKGGPVVALYSTPCVALDAAVAPSPSPPRRFGLVPRRFAYAA
eukprot:SAG22_NODE_2476_length_2530_cov_2.162896_1_plen_89_part_10